MEPSIMKGPEKCFCVWGGVFLSLYLLFHILISHWRILGLLWHWFSLKISITEKKSRTERGQTDYCTENFNIGFFTTLCNLAKADALFEDHHLVLSVLRLVIYSTQQIVQNVDPQSAVANFCVFPPANTFDRQALSDTNEIANVSVWVNSGKT